MNKIWISLGSAIAVAAPVSAVTAYLMLRNKNTTTTTNTTNTAPAAESSIKYLEDTPIKTLDGYTIESQKDDSIYVEAFDRDRQDLDAKMGLFTLKEEDLKAGQIIKVDSLTPGKQTELTIITSIEAKDIDSSKKDFSANIEASADDGNGKIVTKNLPSWDAYLYATKGDKKNHLLKKDNKIIAILNSDNDLYLKLLRIFKKDKNLHTYTVEKLKNTIDNILNDVNKVAKNVYLQSLDTIFFKIEDKK